MARPLILLCIAWMGTALLQAQNHLLVIGATVHDGNGRTIENAWLEIKEGIITDLSEYGMRTLPEGAEVIDATGKRIYPGIIACNTTLGLVEIEAVRATRDHVDAGEIRPHVRTLIAYNTDSRVIPTLRSNGILLTQVVPQGGLVSGQSSVMYTRGWNWRDAAVRADVGIHVNWPVMFSNPAWWADDPKDDQKNKIYDDRVKEIRNFFADAKAYAASAKTTRVQQLEATRGLFTGDKKLFIHVNGAREIASAVLWAKELGVQAVIVGGRDAADVSELLKKYEVPVILSNLHALPHQRYSPVDEPFSQAARLYEAGVSFALSMNGFWQQRSLPFVAGTAVAYGLLYDEAIRAITGTPAKILGVADKAGTLEPGKPATFIISGGDILDIRNSVVEWAFIAGEEVDLEEDYQKALYRKFRQKYIDQGDIRP